MPSNTDFWQIGMKTCSFGLLTDFRDANEEKLPDDEVLSPLSGRESKS